METPKPKNDLNETSKKSLADLDKKLKIKQMTFYLAGDFVFMINNVYRFVQIVASKQ